MNAPLMNLSHNVRDLVSPEEWDARVNLAACYRLMDYFEMTDLISSHVSVRVSGEWLKRSCDLQVMALSCNMKLRKVSDAVIETTWGAYQPGGRRHKQQKRGLLEWPALLQEIDRIDPSYKT